MKWHEQEYGICNLPEFYEDFVPMAAVLRSYKAKTLICGIPVAIAVSNDQTCNLYKLNIYATEENLQIDYWITERIVKLMLWQTGGNIITLYGFPKCLFDKLSADYGTTGRHAFDADYMGIVYGTPLRFLVQPYAEDIRVNRNLQKAIGGTSGKRIGLDAGGTAIKVCALDNGCEVFSETLPWQPAQQSDISYHYAHIVQSLSRAKSALGSADSVGVSSAGLILNNCLRISSLFRGIKSGCHKEAGNIFLRAAADLGILRVSVRNDGDVAAIAGSFVFNTNNLLGLSLGTSLAGGYVDGNGCITGMINELEFVPVDLNEEAAVHEWSGDRGVGACYFSSDALLRLAKVAGIEFGRKSMPIQKVHELCELADGEDGHAVRVFEATGVCLGHAIALYHEFYSMENVLLLGGQTSGNRGNILINAAQKVLREDYPEINVQLILPDDKLRRTGQAYTAALLPR